MAYFYYRAGARWTLLTTPQSVLRDYCFYQLYVPRNESYFSISLVEAAYRGRVKDEPPQYSEKTALDEISHTWSEKGKEAAKDLVVESVTFLPLYAPYPPRQTKPEDPPHPSPDLLQNPRTTSTDQPRERSIDLSTDGSEQLTHGDSTNSSQAGNSNWGGRTRYGLPITLQGLHGEAAVVACADSGSEENIIRLDIAQIFGLEVLTDDCSRKSFTLANGKVIQAIGQTLAYCQFGTEPDSQFFPCWFYVFENLANPIIMSDNFLRSTHTMTHHRHRLIDTRASVPQAIAVNAIGKTRKRLICKLNGVPTLAFADTGSDLDLMSSSYVRRMGYNVHPQTERLMFADGSLGETAGVVRLRTKIPRGSASRTSSIVPFSKGKHVRFHVLDDLAADVILGEQTLERFSVFTLSKAAFITVEAMDETSALSSIRLLTPLEKGVSSARKKLNELIRKRPDQVKTGTNPENTDLDTFQARVNERDQRELARRETEKKRIGLLPAEARQIAQQVENTLQRRYDEDRKLLIRDFDLSPFQASSTETRSTVTSPGDQASSTPNAETPTNTSDSHQENMQTTSTEEDTQGKNSPLEQLLPQKQPEPHTQESHLSQRDSTEDQPISEDPSPGLSEAPLGQGTESSPLAGSITSPGQTPLPATSAPSDKNPPVQDAAHGTSNHISLGRASRVDYSPSTRRSRIIPFPATTDVSELDASTPQRAVLFEPHSADLPAMVLCP